MVALAAIVWLIAGTASGQDSLPAQDGSAQTRVVQTNRSAPGEATATTASQVSGEGNFRAVPTTIGNPDRNVATPAPSSGASAAPVSQLTAETPRVDAGAQLNSGPRTAEAPASSATPSQSRNIATATPTGPDRCDPQAALRDGADCARVIETRAAEFTPPDHQPLSAEQRLLATQRELRPASTDIGVATRRLGNGEFDDATAALAVASIALGPTTADDEKEEEALPSATEAIVAGIVNMMTGTPTP